jgi:1-hydroxycarotenoid 3,4-desaturase
MLVNSPANGDHAPQSPERVSRAMRGRLRACGLDVNWESGALQVTDPRGFAGLFPATGGALYGRASHGWRASFQRPGAVTPVAGLFLAGGSIHPGPGVPMAALSGLRAAESLMAFRASTPRFRPAGIAGGTSTG